MTRNEAVARALFWAAFGARPLLARANGFGDACAYTERLLNPYWGLPTVMAAGDEIVISCSTGTARADPPYDAHCEQDLPIRALSRWAEIGCARRRIPEMRQMYRDELARLLGNNNHAHPALSGQE